MKMALTGGRSPWYASSAWRMGKAYRVRSRWYCAAEMVTKSSTSGNGSGGAMYMAWRGSIKDGGVSVCGFKPSALPVEWCDDAVVAVVAGRQARISISRTRQSLPPLYDRDSSSGLCVSRAACQPSALFRNGMRLRRAQAWQRTRISAAPPR